MITTPIFKAHLRVEVIPGEGVLILTEDGAKALHGQLYEALVSLIDGSRSVNQIVDALAGRADPAKVYYALMLLEKMGHLTEATPEVSPEIAAFWHGQGIEPQAALHCLRNKQVHVHTLGGVVIGPVREALEDQGITVCDSTAADFTLVVTDDYLRADLAHLNTAALHSGKPWMLVKPVGLETWVGPVFKPGVTGCYRCLSQRLSRNQQVRLFVADKLCQSEPPVVSHAATPATMLSSIRLAALEVAKQLANVPGSLAGKVWSMDSRTWTTQTHGLLKNPSCPECGAAEVARPQSLTLLSRKVSYSQDGGHRTATPEETLKKYQHLVSPITGVVTMLAPVHRANGIAHVYVAGHNHALKMDRLDFLKQSLRNASSGKGISEVQAKVSALCEAIERYSGDHTGAPYRVTASYRELGVDAIHPNAVMCYSEFQFAEREAWNAKKSKFNRVPEVLDDTTRLDWTPVWSLTEQRHKYLPTQFLYYSTPATADCSKVYAHACSNGCASGNHLEEAILQGFFELVERDAVALWWYNRLKKPGVVVESFGEPYLLDLIAYYQSLGRAVWALDLTSDLGIPAFVAISRLTERPQERLLFGLGCHLDARTALQRAFAEMNQMLGMAEGAESDLSLIEDDETVSWLTTATVANQPYLWPDEKRAPTRCSDYPKRHSGDLLQDIELCQHIVEAKGLEMLVLDQTRPDVAMPVAKVIVPGLRHFWARFAPGRLYEVPVKMGWLDAPLSEKELNPVPIFF